jgi:alpha-ketoglutarate-dependent sulfate ester dioxygenase
MSAILEVKDVNAAGLSYTPLHPTIGAEVEGVDLSQPISDTVRDDIKASLLLCPVSRAVARDR